jgi:predicted RND superfamily exporter protein
VSTLLLISDIDDVIFHDAPRATLLALSLVCGLVLVVLRRLRASITVMGTLLVGVAMLVGAAAAAGVRMNFLNFVVLPITFGIGVDYAVNIVHRWQHERRLGGSLGRVLRETGSAVALCSATTIIGYASLMVADSQALAGFGLLAALGEVTCLFSALFVLPAWLLRRMPAGEVDFSLAAIAPAAAPQQARPAA